MLENIIFSALVAISLIAAGWVLWMERHTSSDSENKSENQ